MGELISVIVPVYNVENSICKCVDSILHQTYKNLQIVLIDDGSTDCSGKICDEYARKESRITIVHKNNEGPFKARLEGIKVAKGCYIGFVDSDDYIDENMYECLLNGISDYDFIHTGYYMDNDSYIEGSFEGTFKWTKLDEKERFIKEHIFSISNNNIISSSIFTKLFRADFIKSVMQGMMVDLRFGEDLVLLCNSVLKSEKIRVVNKAFYHYCSNEQSIMHQIGDNRLHQIADLSKELHSLMNKYQCEESLFLEKRNYINWILSNYLKNSTCFSINRYSFQDVDKLLGKRVILYGAGQVGEDYYSQLSKYRTIDIVAWVDRKELDREGYGRLDSPEIIKTLDFDYIVVALKDKERVEEVTEILNKQYLISKEKIVWEPVNSLLNKKGL